MSKFSSYQTIEQIKTAFSNYINEFTTDIAKDIEKYNRFIKENTRHWEFTSLCFLQEKVEFIENTNREFIKNWKKSLDSLAQEQLKVMKSEGDLANDEIEIESIWVEEMKMDFVRVFKGFQDKDEVLYKKKGKLYKKTLGNLENEPEDVNLNAVLDIVDCDKYLIFAKETGEVQKINKKYIINTGHERKNSSIKTILTENSGIKKSICRKQHIKLLYINENHTILAVIVSNKDIALINLVYFTTIKTIKCTENILDLGFIHKSFVAMLDGGAVRFWTKKSFDEKKNLIIPLALTLLAVSKNYLSLANCDCVITYTAKLKNMNEMQIENITTINLAEERNLLFIGTSAGSFNIISLTDFTTKFCFQESYSEIISFLILEKSFIIFSNDNSLKEWSLVPKTSNTQ